jgi:tetratricopeptide (TPR) repeat protein
MKNEKKEENSFNFDQAKTNFKLGIEKIEKKQYEEAEIYFRLSLSFVPTRLSTLINLGAVLITLNKIENAEKIISQTLSLYPNDPISYLNKSRIFVIKKDWKNALEKIDQAILLNPHYAEAFSNRANILYELYMLDAALESAERAIELNNTYSEAYYNYGIILKELDRLDDSLENFDKAINLNQNYTEAYTNRGVVLLELNRLEEALLSNMEALKYQPDHPEANWNISIINLLLGEYDEGFSKYEWRWRSKTILNQMGSVSTNKPNWLGNQDLKNKKILVQSEQGLGDTIQFCRYCTLLKKIGGKVILKVQNPLIKLLSNIDGVDLVAEDERHIPEYDFQTSLMSLPFAFKTNLKTVPNNVPYLNVDKVKKEVWMSRLETENKPTIGLVWSGSTKHKNDRNRSIKLTELKKYLPKGFNYVCLQSEIREIDKLELENSNIKHFESLLRDFSDTAALCSLMDIVISVDTSVAHLAGALNIKTWILLPYMPDWRWMLERTDSPWYPSVTLIRQNIRNDWDYVLNQVREKLNGFNEN